MKTVGIFGPIRQSEAAVASRAFVESGAEVRFFASGQNIMGYHFDLVILVPFGVPYEQHDAWLNLMACRAKTKDGIIDLREKKKVEENVEKQPE